MSLITITKPEIEPVSLEELQDQVRQNFAVDAALLASCGAAARAHVEAFTRLRLIEQVVELRRDGLGGVIRLPVAPVMSVDEISYLDCAGEEQVLATGLWRVRRSVMPWQIIPAHLATWPTVLPDLDTVGIRMTVGFGPAASDVPEDLRAAIKSLAAHFYENREAVVIGAGAAELPLGVRDMLLPHVLWV
jgi:uncharacterized phiE125 gp8 family phage protein